MKQPKKERIPKEPIIYDGVVFDSSFEVLFVMWLKESITAGYVARYKYHPDPIVIQESISREYELQGKTKVLIRTESLFQKVVYTPDFIIIWTEKAEKCGLVVSIDNRTRRINDHPFVGQRLESGMIRSIIDVKPPTKQGGANASYRDLAIKRPIIWKQKGYYIQAIVPINPKKIDECLFSRTWAPKEYLERPRKDGKGYLMNYCKQITIEDYERNKTLVV